MKKFLSILCTLMLITSVSCSRQTEKSPEQLVTQNYTAEKLSNIVAYRKENMSIPENCNQVWSFMPYSNGTEYLLLGSGMKIPEFWHTTDFENYEIVEFPEFDIGRAYDLDTANDGTVVTLLNHTDEEPDENGEYPENAEYRLMIKTYSKDGKLASSADVADFGVIPDGMTDIRSVHSDGSTVIVLVSGAYEIFSIDGTYIGELVTDDGDIDAIGKDKDGKLICTVAYVENDKDKLKVCYINPDGTLSDYNSAVYDFEETPQGIQQGAGDYSFFLWSRSTIFGIKPDGEIVSLFNIHASGMTSDSINGFFITDGGNMAVISNDYSNYCVNFRKYIPRTKEEMDGIPVLTLGIFGNGEWVTNEFINPWNDEGHNFMLEMKSYESEIDDKGIEHFDKFQEDMLSGNLPDIILTDGTVGNINLAEAGVLCDLYEFIDNDSEISRETFVPNVLECFETDGKLYSLPDRFYLDVGMVAKTKFVGDGSDWDFDKYVDMIVNPPVDVEIDYDSKERRFGLNLSSDDWIDFDTYTCHYTDDSFIKYLNWCNEAENIESVYPDFEERTEEEDRADYVRQQRRYIDDKAIFTTFSWLTYTNYVRDTRGAFGGEEITYLETPKLHGDNNIAVTSTSEHKELAWEYIKSRISDESYEMPENGFELPFPVTKTGLEYYENYERTHYMDFSKYDEITDPEWRNYKGVTYQLADCIYGDTVIKLGEITDEDVKAVNDMIARAEPSSKSYIPLGFDFYSIINEEINIFFNGDCTAEECAEIIQNRASIYLSEKFK